jgi:hypothetical protein
MTGSNGSGVRSVFQNNTGTVLVGNIRFTGSGSVIMSTTPSGRVVTLGPGFSLLQHTTSAADNNLQSTHTTIGADGSRTTTTTLGPNNGTYVETINADGSRTVTINARNITGVIGLSGNGAGGRHNITINDQNNSGVVGLHVGNVTVTRYVNGRRMVNRYNSNVDSDSNSD